MVYTSFYLYIQISKNTPFYVGNYKFIISTTVVVLVYWLKFDPNK